MVGFPFQVLGVFSLQKSLLFSNFVFPPSSWAGFLFPGMELLFETGKVSDCLSCNGLGVGR